MSIHLEKVRSQQGERFFEYLPRAMAHDILSVTRQDVPRSRVMHSCNGRADLANTAMDLIPSRSKGEQKLTNHPAWFVNINNRALKNIS